MRLQSWLIAELLRTTQGTLGTPKVHIECRKSDALGHSRGRPYQGSAPTAEGTPASSLWDSGGFLLLLQPCLGLPLKTALIWLDVREVLANTTSSMLETASTRSVMGSHDRSFPSMLSFHYYDPCLVNSVRRSTAHIAMWC